MLLAAICAYASTRFVAGAIGLQMTWIQLVVLEIQAAGTIRSYYGFIPTGAPRGYFSCRGSLIDLSNNKLLWTAVGVQIVPIEKPWDQPSDSYPNVTTAFYRALEGAKTMMVRNLLSTAPAPLASAR